MPAITRTEKFSKRLRRLREERGMSQRDLSKLTTGCSFAYISRLEAGTRTASGKAIKELAAGLGVTPLYLETGQTEYCPYCDHHYAKTVSYG